MLRSIVTNFVVALMFASAGVFAATQLNPNQLQSGGAASNDFLRWNGTAWVPKKVNPQTISDATSITPDCTYDFGSQQNTQATGTLTINAPGTCTPSESQPYTVRIKSTNVQTFSWNSAYVGSSDLALPTASTGSSKFDYITFRYNAVSTKWNVVAKNFGF